MSGPLAGRHLEFPVERSLADSKNVRCLLAIAAGHLERLPNRFLLQPIKTNARKIGTAKIGICEIGTAEIGTCEIDTREITPTSCIKCIKAVAI